MNRVTGLLGTRALNHWRLYHLPSYIGLRLFLEQVPNSASSDYLIKYLHHKLFIRSEGRYYPYLKFKSIDQDNEIKYRPMYAASPSTALAESYVLQCLSLFDSFQDKPYIYSYNWSKDTSGLDFTYFYTRYRERNRFISQFLRKNPEYVLIVDDIKNFYPTINKEIIFERFKQKLADNSSNIKPESLRLIVSVCSRLLESSENGIPIGPALSHVFGNIALESVDSCLYEKLGMRYLRYVDDIIMLVRKDEVEDINNELEHKLRDEGFELNDDKHDEVISEEWFSVQQRENEIFSAQKFYNLIKDIKLFLWWQPSRQFSLNEYLRNEGYIFPTKRYALTATYGRFHHFMRVIIQQMRDYKRVMAARLSRIDEQHILNRISKLGQEFFDNLSEIEQPNLKERPLINKIRTQRIRYIINRLFYLMPVDKFDMIEKAINDNLELFEQRCVLKAVSSGDIKQVLHVSGNAINTYASIAKEMNIQIKLPELASYTPSLLESILTLMIYECIDSPKQFFDLLNDKDKEMYNFCAFNIPNQRNLMDHSYEDELRSIQLGAKKSLLEKLMTTRFSDLEQINLEALLLSDYYS